MNRVVFTLITLLDSAAFAQITNGTPDDNDEAAVALRGNGLLVCSGVVASARVVLTAAHCVEGGAPPEVFFGSDPAAGGTTIAVSTSRSHPEFDPETFAFDLGMIVLAEPAPATPWTLRTTTPPDGATVRVIGYGLLDAGDATPPRRREGTAQITAIDPTAIELAAAPSQPCTGDSGGPVVLDDELVAVISSGDPACTASARATRVDALLDDFVAPFLAETADGAAAAGARCWHDDNCADGACIIAADDDRVRYCSTACTGDDDCPGGMRCDDGCRWPAPSPGALGSACADVLDCVTGACAESTCTQVCVAGVAGTCPDGFTCVTTAGGDDYCFDDEPPGCGCASSRDPASGALVLVIAVAASRRRGGRRHRRRCRARRAAPG